MAIDFSTLQLTDETRILIVKHPATGEEVAQIELLSITADKPRRTQLIHDKRRMKDLQRNRALDPEAIQDESLDVLAACTVSWSGVEWQGKPLDCTRQNATMLYKALPWLREEVTRFVNDVSLFLENSATASPSSPSTTSGSSSE